MCTAVLIGGDPATPFLPAPRIWAQIQGGYWSAKVDDIFLWLPGISCSWPPGFGQKHERVFLIVKTQAMSIHSRDMRWAICSRNIQYRIHKFVIYGIVNIKCATLLYVNVDIIKQIHYRVELHQRYCTHHYIVRYRVGKRTPHYHNLALCLYQLMEAWGGGGGYWGGVLLCMCVENTRVQRCVPHIPGTPVNCQYRDDLTFIFLRFCVD
jgi:hypothetical protein